MNSEHFAADFTLAAMAAWNTLTELMEEDQTLFEDPSEFETFYSAIMDQLHAEDSKE